MGQMTVGILYGCKPPKGVLLHDEEAYESGLFDRWYKASAAAIEAAQAKINAECQANPGMGYRLAYEEFEPAHELDGDVELLGFWIAAGASGKSGLPRLETPTPNAKRLCAREPYATAYRNAVERWGRFAAWAATQGVKLPRAKLWVTQTEVA